MEQETAGLDILISGSLYVRSEWLVVISEDTAGELWPEPPPQSLWSRTANSLLTIAQVTHEAVRLFRNSNRFLQNPGEQYERHAVGLQLQGTPSFVTSEAHTRALELLRSWLSSEQLASFERSGSFEVHGGRSGRRYLLRSKYAFGIEVLEGREKGLQLCVVPQGAPALGDILLAQKIGLERCELATLAKANKWRPEELAV